MGEEEVWAGKEQDRQKTRRARDSAGFTVERLRRNRTGIPDEMLDGMEALSGFSFDDVRVHYDSRKPERVHAYAYTQGSEVYIGPGQERCLPHELGHVIQQKQGRVQTTAYLGKTAVNVDRALEWEADRLGRLAQGQKKTTLSLRMSAGGGGEQQPLQMEPSAKFDKVVKVLDGTFKKSDGPVMIYETFGNKEEDLLEIYKLTCKYPGNTICIMGLNRRSMITEYEKAPLPDISILAGKLKDHGAKNEQHKAWIVPFKWKSVGGKEMENIEAAGAGQARGGMREKEKGAFDAADKKIGYAFPYYEVRGYLMDVAIAGMDEERIPTDRVLFRWIDRDARDVEYEDKSKGKGKDAKAGASAEAATAEDKEMLNKFSKAAKRKTPLFISGSYAWRPDMGAYKKDGFMNKFNDYERSLRQKWFEINKKTGVPSSNFYLPEPALIMNYAAHKEARGNLWKACNESAGKKQDQESMKAFGTYNSVRDVEFWDSFSVSKPNKTLPDGKTTYLQQLEELIKVPLKQRKKITYDVFCGVLSGVRQSAFDNGNWAFKKREDYRKWYEEGKGAPADCLDQAELWFIKEKNYLASSLYDYYQKNAD